MAALDDSGDTWVDEIYQIEQTDPVLGGPPNEATRAGLSNIPIQQLAKRTSWLKRFFAPIDSPDLTGSPTAPTPAVADNSTRVATTGWVRSALATLAAAAGFTIVANPIGAIRLPTWLGSFQLVWGYGTIPTTTALTITFPLAFGTAVWGGTVSQEQGTSAEDVGIVYKSLTGATMDNYPGTRSVLAYWMFWGR